jgi:hypothetical protein
MIPLCRKEDCLAENYREIIGSPGAESGSDLLGAGWGRGYGRGMCLKNRPEALFKLRNMIVEQLEVKVRSFYGL